MADGGHDRDDTALLQCLDLMDGCTVAECQSMYVRRCPRLSCFGDNNASDIPLQLHVPRCGASHPVFSQCSLSDDIDLLQIFEEIWGRQWQPG
eukprot:m.30556 g.30556  ORF g.30556 m.30556 type:complete len:93 (-) comp6815_c0_seq1:812-1090(-)